MALLYKSISVCAQPPSMWERMTMTVDPNRGSEVPVSIECDRGGMITAQYNWQMQLQRYENGRWNVIGERFGYVSQASPSHRTFTNISDAKNTPCRVALLTGDYYGNKTIISDTFIK